MADFRKSLVLAAAVLAFGVTASAQSTCTGTTGAPPVLRSEGNTELTGTVLITCSDVPIGTSINLDLVLNGGTLPITSRSNEAAVQVSNSGAVTQTVVGVPGTLPNHLNFNGLNLPQGTDIITITGVRANVTPAFEPIGPGGFGVVATQVAISNSSLPLLTNNFTTGLVEVGFGGLSAVASGANFSTCAGTFVAQSASSSTFSQVKFSELFPTAFKVQGAFPGNGLDSESGTNPALASQVATNATQFAVTFNNIPTGVTLYVPLQISSTNASGGGSAVLVTSEGNTTPVSGSGVVTIPGGVQTVAVTAGTTLFYNVTSVDPSSIDTFSVPVYFSVAAGGATSAGSTTVSVTYAPRQAPSTAFVPRFTPGGSSSSGSTVNLFSTASTCQTTLLFTFLTNQAGFDTGFSIAGTGTGLFGDPKQGGTCTINLYGANAPTTAPTLAVPSAGEGHTTISVIAPGFQGFGVAVCNFNYAHGYAFLSDGFMGTGKGLSEGYTANELLRGAATSTSASTSTTLNDSLGH